MSGKKLSPGKADRNAREPARRLTDRLEEVADHCASLPVLRDRATEKILGYDERGMPISGRP
jgi:hypothetical protein